MRQIAHAVIALSEGKRLEPGEALQLVPQARRAKGANSAEDGVVPMALQQRSERLLPE